MAHGHSHDTGPAPRASRRVRLVLTAALAPFFLATGVGLVLLWPHGDTPAVSSPQYLDNATLEDATVVRAEVKPCGLGGTEGPSGPAPTEPAGSPAAPVNECVTLRARLETGPEAGTTVELPSMLLGGIAPNLADGDGIVLSRSVVPQLAGAVYNYSDQQRRAPLVALGALFVVVVVGIARLRGVSALVGLAVTLLILVKFMLPAILEARDPIAVALVGSSAAMIVILYLTHGFNARTATALLGTLVSLLLTAGLAVGFVSATKITGQSEDEFVTLAIAGSRVTITGLLLAGIIIGALGVLNDVTVTQASAVWELHRANPALSGRRLYHSTMRIGRDHIASVVDTLVLAYAGASLPLLVLFAVAPRPLGAIFNGEIVAIEIVRTLVGSIGLILSVPITTALAALVVARSRADLVGSDAEAHGDKDDRDEPGRDGDEDERDTDASSEEPLVSERVAAALARKRTSWRQVRDDRRRSKDAAWKPSKGERDFWDEP